MRSTHTMRLSRPETYRPSPAVLRRVHGLRRLKGKIAAIEPRSGKYFVANSTMDALRLARRQHPSAIFYIVRVGQRTAHAARSPNRRIGK